MQDHGQPRDQIVWPASGSSLAKDQGQSEQKASTKKSLKGQKTEWALVRGAGRTDRKRGREREAWLPPLRGAVACDHGIVRTNICGWKHLRC